MIHTYLIGLGDFTTDDYEARGSLQMQVVWVLFLAATFLIQLTFMNMLIAIMSDVYSQVTATILLMTVKHVRVKFLRKAIELTSFCCNKM